MSDLVRIERLHDGVHGIVLNRPDKRNALSIALMRSLCEAIDGLSADPAVRVIVVRGEGPAFCAGLDLVEGTDPSRAHESAELVARMLLSIAESPKVVIAAAHGAAVAGGAGVLMACDLAVAAGDLRMGFPEVRRGLVAGMVMTLLRRRALERDARELLLTGALVDAERALAMGLVNRVVAPDRLVPAAELLANEVAEGAPGAIAHTKALFQSLWPATLRADIDKALALHKVVRTSDEALEGMRAFAEKRPPNWISDKKSGR